MRQPPEFLREAARRSRERQGLPMHLTDPRIIQGVRAVISEHADRLAREAATKEDPPRRRRRAS